MSGRRLTPLSIPSSSQARCTAWLPTCTRCSCRLRGQVRRGPDSAEALEVEADSRAEDSGEAEAARSNKRGSSSPRNDPLVLVYYLSAGGDTSGGKLFNTTSREREVVFLAS